MIEQATGVISERAGADLAEALPRLRGHARSHKLSLTTLRRRRPPRPARGPSHPPGAILTAPRHPRMPAGGRSGLPSALGVAAWDL